MSSCVSSFPYLLCDEAASRIENHALFPLEWLRLAALHGPGEDRLGEGFYDSFGAAIQPKISMLVPSWAVFPPLGSLPDGSEAIVDIAIAWDMGDDVVDGDQLRQRLASMSPVLLSDGLGRRILAPISPNAEVIAIRILGVYCVPECGPLIEERLKTAISGTVLPDLLQVASMVLPEDPVMQAFERAVARGIPPASARATAMALKDAVGIAARKRLEVFL